MASDDIKNIVMPLRDTILSSDEVMLNDPSETPLLFDLSLNAEDALVAPSKDLIYFEEFLWKTLLVGINSSSSSDRLRNHLQKIFNVSNYFIKIVQMIPLTNIADLYEDMLLSFAPSLKMQRDLITYINLHKGNHIDTTHIDLNAKRTDVLLWQQFIHIIEDKNDKLGTIPLRMGLCKEFYELFNEFSVNDLFSALLVQGMFQVKLRCSEEIIINILLEEKDTRIKDLRRLKTNQILSSSEAEYTVISSKINLED